MRAILRIAFWCLMLVWVVAPEDPGRIYAWTTAGAGVVTLVVASWPVARRRAAQVLRKPLRIADLVAVNAIVALVLAEIVLGIAAATLDSPFLARNDARAAEQIRLFRLRPGADHLGHPCNDLGFYDDAFTTERKPGVRRVLALGDSFVVGVVPFEQNHVTLLEQHLGARTLTEVLNFGVAGVGPHEYLHLWASEACRYDPDVVLLYFFVGNDFVRRSTHSLFYPDSLRVVSLAERLVGTGGLGRAEEVATAVADPDAATFTPEEYDRIERGRMRICRRGRDERRFDRTAELLEQLSDATGPRLRVVIIPDEFQVNDALWRHLVGDRENELDRELPNRWLLKQLQSLGVPALDLLPALREAERDAPTHKLRDTHWNAHGNAVAARAVADWLEQRGDV